jgi:CTP synthase (UTP-ammonia lyase)
MKRICIGIVGDFDENMYTHVALNQSINHCRTHLPFDVDDTWIPTTDLKTLVSQNRFHGYWVAPGSPYKNDENVYQVISHSRNAGIPTLGSCGGFQYMIIEYARNVLGWSGAAHEESDPESELPIISKLSCSLKGREEKVIITDQQSWLYNVMGTREIPGHFFCNYGVNPKDQKRLNVHPLVFTAFSESGEARAFELRGHPFFNGTLFQPSLDSTAEKPNPLVVDFLKRCRVQN